MHEIPAVKQLYLLLNLFSCCIYDDDCAAVWVIFKLGSAGYRFGGCLRIFVNSTSLL